MFNTNADYVKCVYHYKAHLSKIYFVPEIWLLHYDQVSFVIVHISEFMAPPTDHIVIYDQL